MLCRMSTKLNGMTPNDLPRNLKFQYESLLQHPCSLEAYIRPGCVHLTLKYSLSTPEGQAQEVRPTFVTAFHSLHSLYFCILPFSHSFQFCILSFLHYFICNLSRILDELG
jgi:hypothetical protein